METKINWRSISDRPKRSGSVLIALKHNGVKMVIMGNYNKRTDTFLKKLTAESETLNTSIGQTHITQKEMSLARCNTAPSGQQRRTKND